MLSRVIRGWFAGADLCCGWCCMRRKTPAVYTGHSSAEQLVLALVEEGWTSQDIDSLPVGLALPLRDALRSCRIAPPRHWPRAAYELVGRHDLARMRVSSRAEPETAIVKTGSNPNTRSRADDSKQTGWMDGTVSGSGDGSDADSDAEGGAAAGTGTDAAADLDSVTADTVVSGGGDEDGGDEDGTVLVSNQSKLLFSRDLRLKEVRRILRSNRVISITLPKERLAQHSGDVSELLPEQQQRLILLSLRTLAQPIGRGMYTLASTTPPLSEGLPVPPIVLVGRLSPRIEKLKLDLALAANAYESQEFLDWPSYHNGVAAGVRVAGAVHTGSGSGSADASAGGGGGVSRAWIMYNRPSVDRDRTTNFSHAGFLLALGLCGHLKQLSIVDVFQYLTLTHEPTTISVLLGASASHRGTSDQSILKQLCLHIPALLPASLAAETGSYVHTAAVMGVGLLFQGTAHRLMTEMLLAEIGRRPTTDKCADREGHSLAAGLALGLVTLGCGSDSLGLADLGLESRLMAYIVGGRESSEAGVAGSKAGAASILLDAFGSPNSKRSGFGNDPKKAAAAAAAAAGNPNKPSTIKEDDIVNVDVTAPGATLALGLMFIKRNASAVAARLAVPDTHFMLDYVRPDLLLLRVLCRNLIMWDGIEPSIAWVQGHMTAVIRDNIWVSFVGLGFCVCCLLIADSSLAVNLCVWCCVDIK